MVLGQVISGKFGEICVRQKSNENIEMGELLIAENKENKVLMQVYDLIYGSQISQQNLELISGLNLEEGASPQIYDSNLRTYKLALLKNLITIKNFNSVSNFKDGEAKISKALPDFFSFVREVKEDDLKFITTPKNPLYLGNLRSGSKMLNVPISLPAIDVLSHHVLLSATTGKGKSNLLSVMLWGNMGKDYCSFLILDPHDEYYGRNKLGLKDHVSKNLIYYTPKDVPVGQRTLQINLKSLKPHHFQGSASFTDAQSDLVRMYYKRYGDSWIEAAVLEKELWGDGEKAKFQEVTIAVVNRKLQSLLDLNVTNDTLFCNGIFSKTAGDSTVQDIANELEKGKTVIVDTSSFQGDVEILIGSLITSTIYEHYKRYKQKGELNNKPVVSIVLEEAPRVLGKEVLEEGPNIFSTIAREGRKFKVGLIAITQLPSLIPRTILANMNTKIILGIEMAQERQSIIESAAQDLSADNRNIASLDKGEAIVTSNFARFATPIKIPLFEDFIKTDLDKESKLKQEKILRTDLGKMM